MGKLKEKAEARKADANAEYRAEEDQIMADYGRVRFYQCVSSSSRQWRKPAVRSTNVLRKESGPWPLGPKDDTRTGGARHACPTTPPSPRVYADTGTWLEAPDHTIHATRTVHERA